MNRRTRAILFASIAVIILGLIFFPRIKRLLSTGEQNEAPAGGPSPVSTRLSVSAMVLEPQTLDNLFRITGVLLPEEEVDLVFETSGKITDIFFKEGTNV